MSIPPSNNKLDSSRFSTSPERELNKVIEADADHIKIPKTLDLLNPIISVVPMQLIAYYTALLKGTDVDKPRNLAKSVTVE